MVTLAVNKDAPTEKWIDDLRRRFPCESEVDRVLTRKLSRRAGPGYTPVSLEEMRESICSLLRSALDGPFEVQNVRWLSGGASKIQVAFRLHWTEPDHGFTATELVVRMEPAESIVESSRLREFQAIRSVGGILPVPKVYWLDLMAVHFPYPTIIYGFANGVTKPSGVSSNVTGLGINFGPYYRKMLAPQFIDQLGSLHLWDWRHNGLDSFDVPPLGDKMFESHLNWWERVWEEDSNRDIPLMRVAAGWLRENIRPASRLSMIHGDYRPGNFLFDEKTAEISAWLDWELSHLGDFHEDLAYTTLPSYAHWSEDGKVLLASGFMPANEIYEGYERRTGLKVDLKTIDYYQVFHQYRIAVIVLATGYRAARNGKTHQDLLLNWIMGLGYTMLGALRSKLEEVG